MKKFLAALFFLFAVTQSIAIEFAVQSSTAGTPFTYTLPPFVASPVYTSYSINMRSLIYPKNVTNQYKYVTISGVVLKDQSGNIISTTWTHTTATLGSAVIDNWTSNAITGLTNGMTYTLAVTGTGWCVGATCAAGATSEFEGGVTAQ